MLNNSSQDYRQPTPRRKRRTRAALNYHSIRCTVCRHPHRETIEHDYIHWHSPARIAREYPDLNSSAIYRHVHATALDAKRRRNAISSLEFIIEKAESVVPTANEIINAVRACCRLNQHGQWIDPPKQRIVTYVDGRGNPLSTHSHAAATSGAQSQTSQETNVTSPKIPQNQSPTPPIRNWFMSLKTKTTRLIQSPTFCHFSKSQKPAAATQQLPRVSREKVATPSSYQPPSRPASRPPQPQPVASISVNRILGFSVPGSLRVSVTPWQDPASIDVHVAHLLL